MHDHASTEVESTETIDDRDVRALTSCLTVLPDLGRAKDATDLYMVVSDSGREYLVDARTGACECPDHEYRGVRCKHLRRVEFATGDRDIPESVESERVDDLLGTHVDAVAVADGGQAVETPVNPADAREPAVEYTYHVEPAAQGGEEYVRCEGCGAEVLTRHGGTNSMIHRSGCPAGEGR